MSYSKVRKYVDSCLVNDSLPPLVRIVYSPPCNVQLIVDFTIITNGSVM